MAGEPTHGQATRSLATAAQHQPEQAQARQSGATQAHNTPAELPRIAQVLAQLRGIELEELQAAVWRNAQSALPKLASVQ